MKKKAVAGVVLAMTLAGCASSPDKIQTASVSTMQYNSYECGQVGAELDRVNRRANDLHASLEKKANDDAAQMAVGAILFWPALFFLEGGDGPEATEYSRLKGEREALEKVAIQKNCDPAIIPKPAPAPAKTAESEAG